MTDERRHEGFTPGPWSVYRGWYVIDELDRMVATADQDRPLAVAEANAKLCSDAPRLLAENAELREHRRIAAHALHLCYHAVLNGTVAHAGYGKARGDAIEAGCAALSVVARPNDERNELTALRERQAKLVEALRAALARLDDVHVLHRIDSRHTTALIRAALAAARGEG